MCTFSKQVAYWHNDSRNWRYGIAIYDSIIDSENGEVYLIEKITNEVPDYFKRAIIPFTYWVPLTEALRGEEPMSFEMEWCLEMANA